jgi:hypothetical protein
MTFELKADGIHFFCSSPALARKFIERGATLVDESKAEDLRRALESAAALEPVRPAAEQPHGS